MAAAKKGAAKAAPAPVAGEKKRRGRSSLTINVPVNRQTLSLLETCVTLGQATSTEAVAAKLLARAADDLKTSMAEQIAGNFLAREKK
jgi:hypothetical protein